MVDELKIFYSKNFITLVKKGKAINSYTKISICQIAPKVLDSVGNLKKHIRFIKQAAKKGAKLIVFPEMAISGYCYSSWNEVAAYGEPIPGPITKILSKECKNLGIFVVVGMIEKDGSSGEYSYYNTSILIGPAGILGKYRKTHVPYMAADRFLSKGDLPYRVINTSIGKIGLGICYDIMFPEQARTLALKGMEILVNISNLAKGLEGQEILEHPAFLLYRVRAFENRVFIVAPNRVGIERGYEFIGRSQILAPDGKVLVEASRDREEIIYTTIEPKMARGKNIISEIGKREMHLFDDRRPDLYELG